MALGFGFAIVVVIAIIGENSPPQPQGNRPHGGGCESDWAKCADNTDLVNNYKEWAGVEVDCQDAASKKSEYGTPKWPWLSFGKFLRGDSYVKSGIAVAIEDDAQFSNSFGAMVHSSVMCRYDLRTNRVLDVDIVPR